MFDGFGFGGGVWFALAHLVCFCFVYSWDGYFKRLNWIGTG